MTEEDADQLTLVQRVGRLEEIGVVHGRIRRLAKDYIRAFAPEIRSFLRLLDNQGSREGTVLVDGKPVIINGKVVHGKQEAVKELFHVSYQYVFSILYPRLPKPRKATTVDSPPLPAGTATMTEVNVSDETPHYYQDGDEEESEGADGTHEADAAPEEAVDAEVVQPEAAAEHQPPFTASAPQVTPSAGDGLSGLMGHFKETFAQREGREERLKEFFLMVDDEAFFKDIIHAATGACAVVAACVRQKIAEEKAKQKKPTRKQRREQERQADLERIQEELAKRQALEAKDVSILTGLSVHQARYLMLLGEKRSLWVRRADALLTQERWDGIQKQFDAAAAKPKPTKKQQLRQQAEQQTKEVTDGITAAAA
jgi:hypothetical protein